MYQYVAKYKLSLKQTNTEESDMDNKARKFC